MTAGCLAVQQRATKGGGYDEGQVAGRQGARRSGGYGGGGRLTQTATGRMAVQPLAIRTITTKAERAGHRGLRCLRGRQSRARNAEPCRTALSARFATQRLLYSQVSPFGQLHGPLVELAQLRLPLSTIFTYPVPY